MKKTVENLSLLRMIFVVSLVIANVVTGKLIYTGISLFGTVITLPGAAVCYAITFLMTDIISELWGKEEAGKTVRMGFVCQILATFLIIMTQFLPAVDPGMQASYVALLGQNWIFVTGSMIAYLASQHWDVWMFHKIKKAQANISGEELSKRRWMWNNGSTMTSQIIDTVLFIGIAFGLGFGWLFDTTMWPTLFAMMVGQYIFKFILAILDTPFFYFFTRRKEEGNEMQELFESTKL